MKFEISSLNIISSDFGDLNGDFWVNMHVDISEIGGSGAETFNVNVVGITRLKKIVENESIVGRGMLISQEFNEIAVRSFFENLLKKINSDDWEHLYTELGKYFECL